MESDKNIKLIVKVVSNSASEVEIEELNAWMGKSESNRKFYTQVKALWEKLDMVKDNIEFDETAAKEKITLKIRQQQTKARFLRTRPWISAVASILILICIGYVTFLSDSFSRTSHTYFTTGNEVIEIVLPDSSYVWLNENSKLQVTGSFDKLGRKVDLVGEAYFEVRKDMDKIFKVTVCKTVTKVLGTSFNLKKYGDNNVQLIVNSGKVEFYNKFSLRRSELFLAGDKGEFISSDKRIVKSKNKDLNYISWKTGNLIFSDATLDDVCKALTTHYKVNIKLKLTNPGITFTCTFHNDNLDDILSTIAITLDLVIKKSNNGVIIIQSKNH